MTPIIHAGSDFEDILKEVGGKKDKREETPPLLVDGHVDLTYFLRKSFETLPLSALREGPFTLEKAKEAGIKLFCNALYCEDKYNGEEARGHLREILDFTLEHFDGVTMIKEGRDLSGVMEEPDAIGALLLLENADALAESPALTDELMETGVRMVGLTHAGKNRLGDGNGIYHSDGLSKAGREVVGHLLEMGLMLDVAHLHPKCFWQLMDLVEAPIISSHTGIRERCDIQRNIDLAQAREIVMRQGLVGVTFNPEMLTPHGEASIEDIFTHLDTLVQKFGPDRVALGSDFCGFDSPAHGLEDIAETPKLREVMRSHGYDREAVAQIMGRNWLRIYEGFFSA
jgi:membrane dipeptidase